MGNSNPSENISEASKNFTESITSTGYRNFYGEGTTKHISNGIIEGSGDTLASAIKKYNCSFWKETIKNKLLKEKETNEHLLDDIKKVYGLELDDFAAILGDENAFKEHFLLPYYKPIKIMDELNLLLSDIKEIKDAGDSMTENEFNNSIESINKRKNTLSESKLELILTECSAQNENFLIRTFINKIYDFGVLHSAISLDGTIIEWGRGPCGQNLICPNLDIKNFLFAFEIKAKEDDNFFKYIWNKIKDAGAFILNFFTSGTYGKWSLGRANDKKLDQIAKICVSYNRSKYYNPVTNNCQHFVRKILDAIESDFSFEGEFGTIIKKLENEGKIDFIFRGRTFNSREELDSFIKTIDFSKLCQNDKKLLICYKNTFDIYHKSDPDNEKFKSTDESNNYWRELIRREKENL